MSFANKSIRSRRRGFSLLEVILALAILVGALAVIGELVRNGLMGAQSAAAATQAELRAESILAEVVAGSLPMESAAYTPFADSPDWVYSVLVDTAATEDDGMLVVTVTVEPNAGLKVPGGVFSVTRWVRDPAVVEAAQAAEDSATEESAAKTTTTTTTTGN